MRNATALCGCLFGVTGIVDIADVWRALLESRSNPALSARARPWPGVPREGPRAVRRSHTADIWDRAGWKGSPRAGEWRTGARDFADTHQLAADLATAVMTIDQVLDIAMSRRTPRAYSPASSKKN